MVSEPRDDRLEAAYTRVMVGLAIVIAFVLGYGVGAGVRPTDAVLLFDPVQRAARIQGDLQAPEDFRVFWEAWNLVESRFYYELPDSTTRTQGAIEGMVESLDDPYSGYSPPAAAEIIRETDAGEFEGIGAYVDLAESGGVLIVRPFEGSPAEEAGLQPGDIIIAVDGTDVRESSLDDALALVRGPANSQVTLTISREGVAEPFDVEVTRRHIQIPTVRATMLEDNVGYVALFEFNQQSSGRLRQAVGDLLDEGAQSLVLDLRNNPGGFLDQAVDVADLFLPEGDVLIQRDAEGQVRELRSDDGDIAEEIPLVVLVNGGSASASEIVAGAVQDLHRGVLVGEQTFGKGSVQLQYDLSDGSILRVTYAAWFTPDDHAINGEGIQPDLEVPFATQDGPDTQLQAALDYLEQERVRVSADE